MRSSSATETLQLGRKRPQRLADTDRNALDHYGVLLDTFDLDSAGWTSDRDRRDDFVAFVEDRCRNAAAPWLGFLVVESVAPICNLCEAAPS
jgi:hypothetical protein